MTFHYVAFYLMIMHTFNDQKNMTLTEYEWNSVNTLMHILFSSQFSGGHIAWKKEKKTTIGFTTTTTTTTTKLNK